MSHITIHDLAEILRASAGESDLGVDLETADLTLTDLGYDSLALMETAARIERLYGVVVADGDLDRIRTLREFTDYVNTRIAEAAGATA
ncbi:MAG TPA: acyl carrier protein [Streptosporangiaceae bacterium]|jgi:minimal PKS acyl carrier protein|nr:acyl carrier protein [Streptosporangiaceae bacterium]